MKKSDDIALLITALAKAQAAFTIVPRNRVARVTTKSGVQYSYHFADLEDVIQATRPHLAANELVITHDSPVILKDGRPVAVETTATIWHSSGQWLESAPKHIPLDDFMAPAQAIGSATTYGKRYTTQDIVFVSTEEDDDGNTAAGNDAETGKRPAAEAKPNCPQCGTNASVIVSKPEFGGGYVCLKTHKTKPGCGHKWHDEEPKADEPKADHGKNGKNGKADPKKSVAVKDVHIAAINAAGDLNALAAYCKAADLSKLAPPDKAAVMEAKDAKKFALIKDELDAYAEEHPNEVSMAFAKVGIKPADATLAGVEAVMKEIRGTVAA